MFSISACSLPSQSLLQVYFTNGSYTDCYRTRIPLRVSASRYIEAFYTTGIFKLERLILKWLLAKPSTDAEAERLAVGEIEEFAAWSVERRCPGQLLMCDYQGSTRSWLMVTPDGEQASWLYFGSAIVARPHPQTGIKSPGWGFRLLLGFHKLYSRLLLQAASLRLRKLEAR